MFLNVREDEGQRFFFWGNFAENIERKILRFTSKLYATVKFVKF